MWRRGRVGRYGRNTRCGTWPDQQDRAGRVVHDEPGGPAQALRAQPRLVPVPRHDEQVRPGRGGYHHPFGTPFELEPVAARPRPCPSLAAAASSSSPAPAAASSSSRAAGSRARRPNRPAYAPRAASAASAEVTCSSVKSGPGRCQAKGRVHGRPARSPHRPRHIPNELGSRRRSTVLSLLGHGARPTARATARTSAAGTVSSPSLVNSPSSGADRWWEDAPPQQGGQRSGVGQVRADVDAEQHGQHGARPGRRGQRQQYQHGGQVVASRWPARRPAPPTPSSAGSEVPAGQQRAPAPAEPVVGHRLDHDAQAQHEQQERQVGGPHQGGGGDRAAGQRPHRQDRGPGARRPGGVDARRRREGEPGERQRHHRQRDHRQPGVPPARAARPPRSGRWRRTGRRRRTRRRWRPARAPPSARRTGRRPARWPRTPAGSSGWTRAAAARRSSPGGCTRTRAAWRRTSSRAAVANTTGVSSTTVASRLSTAVVTAARRRPGPGAAGAGRALARAIHAPQARNSPSSSHRCASTRIAARKPITGPSCRASAPAWLAGSAPAATRMTAAGTAATASGQPRGLVTAQASTPSRAISEIVSAAAEFSASVADE